MVEDSLAKLVLLGGELLGPILSLVVEQSREASCLVSVCKAWCAFVNNCAELWSTVRVDSVAAEHFSPALLKRQLLCSGCRLRTLNLSCIPACRELPLTELDEALVACPNITYLNLAGCFCVELKNSEVLSNLSNSLQYLNVRDCMKLHPGLPAMLGQPLRHLEAGWQNEHDDDRNLDTWGSIFPARLFREISVKSPNLDVLKVCGYILFTGNTPVDAIRIHEMRQDYVDVGLVANLSHLVCLNLVCCYFLVDNQVSKIVTNCPGLRALNVRCCFQLTDVALLAVADRLGPGLRTINVSCCGFSDEAVRTLISRAPRLRTLDLCYCDGLDKSCVEYLCSDPTLCPDLKMLGAGGLNLGDSEITWLVQKYFRTMEHLGIGSSERITDAGLQQMSRLPNLQKLSAHRLANVTAQGLMDFCANCRSLKAIDASDLRIAQESDETMTSLKEALDERPYEVYGAESSDDE